MKKRRDHKLFLPWLASGYAPADGGVAFVEMNGFGPREVSAKASTNAEWTLITGLPANIQQTNNSWYPAKTGSYTGVRWSSLPVALATNDNFMQMELIGSWTSNADYIGPAVRVSNSAATCYMFLIDGDDYILRKVVADAETDLKTGSLAVAAGDVIRLEAVGTLISAYKNDVLVDSATDSAIASGDPGVIAEGLGSANKIIQLRAGDVPVGNVSVYGGYAAAPSDERHYVDSCFTSNPTDIMNGSTDTSALHVTDHMHWFEIDFLELRVPSRIRTHGQAAARFDWDDVDVLTKVESGDGWTEVATALDLDNDGIDGWRSSGDFSIIQPCRYVRVEINSTLEADNDIATEEVQFFCTTIP